MSARKYTLHEIWHLAVAYRWLILIPVALGLAAAPFLGDLIPLRYRSEALILVVPPQVGDKYVDSTVTEPVEDRLPGISAQILSRNRLEQIILQMDLYKEERSREVMEDVVERMRVRDVQTIPSGRKFDTFRVAYVSDDPATAQQVTQRLADLYIDQNVQDRTRQAESTTQLIATRIEDTRQRLLEQEKKLEAYRKAYPGQMPTQLPGNLQAIQSLRTQLQLAGEAANRARENRMRVEKELSALDSYPLPQASFGGANSAAPPSTAELLEAARSSRATNLQKYTPDHPEIAKIDRLIAELQARLENEAPLSARTNAPARPMSTAEAMQQQKRASLTGELEVITHQLESYGNDERRLSRQIDAYQAKVDVLPTRDAELTELTREYNALNEAYNDLLLKRESASLSALSERRAIGERFEIIDSASRPDKPYNQLERLGVMAAGPGAGLVLALLVIGFREVRDFSFRSKDEVLATLSLPVLASIPVMTSAREREAAVRRKWVLDLAGSAVLVASVVFVVIWQLYS